MAEKKPAKNFTEFVMRENVLAEAPRSEDAEYEEVRDKKTNEVREVIATLKGAKSGVATKLIDQFSDIEEQLAALDKLRGEVKPKIIEKLGDFFDAADEIATRRLQTAKYILTISKKSMKGGTPAVPAQTIFDEDGFFNDLAKLVGMELSALKQLKEKFTTTIPAVAAVPGTEPKEPTLKPKLRESTLLENDESFLSKVKDWAARILAQVKEKFLTKIDAEQAAIEKKWNEWKPLSEKKLVKEDIPQSEKENAVYDKILAKLPAVDEMIEKFLMNELYEKFVDVTGVDNGIGRRVFVQYIGKQLVHTYRGLRTKMIDDISN